MAENKRKLKDIHLILAKHTPQTNGYHRMFFVFEKDLKSLYYINMSELPIMSLLKLNNKNKINEHLKQNDFVIVYSLTVYDEDIMTLKKLFNDTSKFKVDTSTSELISNDLELDSGLKVGKFLIKFKFFIDKIKPNYSFFNFITNTKSKKEEKKEYGILKVVYKGAFSNLKLK